MSRIGNVITTTKGDFEGTKTSIAPGYMRIRWRRISGSVKKYTMIPFKGLYLKYTKNKTDIKINIYPVPNLKNPFLGVHYTKTVGGDIKIGPTAIPALWRENYQALERFNPSEMAEVLFYEQSFTRPMPLISAPWPMKKCRSTIKIILYRSPAMVQDIDPKGFTEWTKPGIRAQLLDKERWLWCRTLWWKGTAKVLHVLNAVSPAFTCSFSFFAACG